MKCKKCGQAIKSFWLQLEPGHQKFVQQCGCKKKTKKTPSFHKYRDPVAFGIDKKSGQEVAIDKKGKRFNPQETRYNLQRDPHGWKAIGKKVRKKDKYGRPMIY